MPIPTRQLSEHRLAEAIRTALDDPGIRARSASLGGLIRAEDEVATAVKEIANFSKKRRGNCLPYTA